MAGFLSRLLRGATAKGAVRGFVFASLADAGEWARAVPGQVIRNPSSAPPWIVVDHSIQSVVAARWPGRLWEVEILQKAPDQPRVGAGYTRAVAVRVGQERPVSILFGPRGDGVLRVVERASSVRLSEVAELAARWSPDAREAYSRAWNRWIARVDPRSIHRGADHGNTLAVFAGGTRSPIGIGFTVLHDVFARRARELAGDDAFVTDDEGDVCLADPWAKAANVLLHAAMALGAPDLVPEPDRAALLGAWAPRARESGGDTAAAQGAPSSRDPEQVDGAYFVESHPTWQCRRSQISAHRRRLARVYQAADGTFRVLRFIRTRSTEGPQYPSGEWWGSTADPSITGTLDDADRLADEFLAGESETIEPS